MLEALQDHFADEHTSLSDDELQTLRARQEHYLANPETGIAWAEIKQRHGQ